MSPAPGSSFFRRELAGALHRLVAGRNRVMGAKFKQLVGARMEKTGESWQTAARNVRDQAGERPSLSPAVISVLDELSVSTTFSVLVGRDPTHAAGPDLVLVRRQAEEKAKNPTYYAASGSVTTTVTRDVHDLLISQGAADDRTVQMIRSYRVTDVFLRVFSGRSFSAQCESCDGWIWCGEQEHEGDCACGQHYRVSFDLRGEDALQLRQEPCCIDCGRELAVPIPSDANPWRPVNTWQLRCDACHKAMPNTPEQVAALNFRVRRRFRRAA